MDERLLRKRLRGFSCKGYRDYSEAIPETFSLSPSTVSRRFIRVSTRKLKESMERRLNELDIIAIVIDGKSFKDDEMIIALGVTEEGKKMLSGFIQAGRECLFVQGFSQKSP